MGRKRFRFEKKREEKTRNNRKGKYCCYKAYWNLTGGAREVPKDYWREKGREVREEVEKKTV